MATNKEAIMRAKRIRSVYTPGMSAREIADKLSVLEDKPVTRSAVTGFYFRHSALLPDCPLAGTNGRRKDTAKPAVKSSFNPSFKRSPRLPPQPKGSKAAAARRESAPPPKTPPLVDAKPVSVVLKASPPSPVKGTEKTLLALTSTDCRWPVGGHNGQTLFCGNQITKKMYCRYHAYLALSPREREKEFVKS